MSAKEEFASVFSVTVGSICQHDHKVEEQFRSSIHSSCCCVMSAELLNLHTPLIFFSGRHRGV